MRCSLKKVQEVVISPVVLARIIDVPFVEKVYVSKDIGPCGMPLQIITASMACSSQGACQCALHACGTSSALPVIHDDMFNRSWTTGHSPVSQSPGQ